ncbi:MAG: ribonuclease III [Calditrichia bacterium]
MDFIKKLIKKDKNKGKNKTEDTIQSSPDEAEIIQTFQKKFNYRFKDPSLITTAFKHRSYLNVSNEERVASNERLEFLGDAVLDLVITHFLFEKFPKRTEGQLSKIKSILVSKPVLAEVAAELSLGNLLLMNRGEEKTGGRQRQSILADALEAVIGAIYLDQGMDEAREFISKYLLVKFRSVIQRELYKNYKSILLEYAQSKNGKPPEYKVIEESGPDHDKEFVVGVYMNGKKISTGKGKSKKAAEQEAAKIAVRDLGLEDKIL